MIAYARLDIVGHSEDIDVIDSIGCPGCEMQTILELVEYNPWRFLGQIDFECSLQRCQIQHGFLQYLIDVVLNVL